MEVKQGSSANGFARVGALCYAAWGLFHCKVAYDIMQLGRAADSLSQGRLYQLAAYMLTISLFVIPGN